MTDAKGTNFANYTASTGVVAVTATTVTTASGTSLIGTNYIYTDASGNDSTVLLAGNTINIQPALANSTVTLTSTDHSLTPAFRTPAIMLNDSFANDTFTANDSAGYLLLNQNKKVYVVNPTTTLAFNLTLYGSTMPLNIVGPGFFAFTGAGSQVDPTIAATAFYLDGGTWRANNTQLNFTSSGAFGVISFRGGVLEITGGNDQTGSSADFTRPLVYTTGTGAAGAVNWNSSLNGDSTGGSGGFSAYGANASVNIGGSATATALTWGVPSSGFVQDGYSLIFGSTKSNARLDFLNPLALDSGAPGNYLLRTINVIGGVGGDATVLVNSVTGSTTTDLLKAGTGTLVLAGNNAYGKTFVQQGTLLANNATSSLGSGNVVVSSGATLGGAGTIAPAAGNTVTINSGGVIAPGGIAFTPGSATGAPGTSLHTIGTLTINADTYLLSGSTFAWNVNNATAAGFNTGTSGTPGTQNDLLAIAGGINTLNAGNINFQVLETGLTLSASSSYSWEVGTNAALPTLGTVTFNLVGAPDFAHYSGTMILNVNPVNNGIYLNLTPVPEPSSMLFCCAAAGTAVSICRRLRSSVKRGHTVPA